MLKKRTYIILIFIFILSFFAGNLSEPKYFNQGIDFLNSKFKTLNLKFTLPYFWQVPFKLGLDLQGGTQLLYDTDLSQIKPEEYSSAMEGLKDVLEKRINFFGVKEPVVQVEKNKKQPRLLIELAGVKDPGQAIKEIGKTPFLEFRQPKENLEQIIAKQEEIKNKSFEEIQKIENWQLAFEEPFSPTPLTGKYLKQAKLDFDLNTQEPLVHLNFNDEGVKIFQELTKNFLHKPIAIYIDGILISAPIVQEEISTGQAQISGKFTLKEAQELVRNLNAGALPLPIKLVSQQTVGPILGKISLEQSFKAGLFGFLVVILFMILFYRLPGLVSALVLVIYVVLNLALFKLIPITLTLAGIAGFILSIGMAVDANILIFSRMKEELANRKENKTQEEDFSFILGESFRRAWPSIRDSNFNTILVSLILFSFGASFVKGFAFTLILGVLISMFSAIFITQNFLKCFIGTKFEKWKWLWK